MDNQIEKKVKYYKSGDKIDIRYLDSSFSPVYKKIFGVKNVKELANFIIMLKKYSD